jgi:uncharacterized protein YycO
MLQPFSFIFYKKSGLIADMIKWFTKGRYSHVTLLLDRLHTLELSWKTPTSIKHFNYPKDSYDVYVLSFPLSQEQKERIIEFIIHNISVRYDWLFILTRGLNLVFGTKILNSPNRYNCDELIVKAFEYAGIKLVPNIKKLTPDELAKSPYLKRIR